MKHLRWSAAGLCIVALAACDSTPVDPGNTSVPAVGGFAVTAPVLGAVPVPYDGHQYDAVGADGGITWTDARAAAEAMSSGSCQGYLASITTPEENAFIVTEFQGGVPSIGGPGYWIGGFQDSGPVDAAEGWMWVSGEAFGFTDWATGQPDGVGGLTEDAIRFVGSIGGLTPTVNWDDVERAQTTPGYVVEFEGDCTEAALIEVMLKLKQGEGARNINLKSRGKIAAAVLSVDGEFDATTIDPTTVTLGDGADPDAHVAGNPHGKLMVAWPDLNEDGLQDALFHFNTQDLVAVGLTAETTELVLHGMTTDDVEFTGTDAVAVK
jgi:hypothetical protein